MAADWFDFVGALLGELSKDNKIWTYVRGTMKDGLLVGGATTLGGLLLGRAGAIGGALFGAVALSISKAWGHGQYKQLINVLNEDLTANEKKRLFWQIWNIVKPLLSDPNNFCMTTEVLMQILRTVLNNLDILSDIVDLIRDALKNKNIEAAAWFALVDELLQKLSENDKIRTSVGGAVNDGLLVGGATTVGGLLLGRKGAIGGAVFGAVALSISRALGHGQYKPLLDVLNEDLTEDEKKQLYSQIWEVLRKFVTDPQNIPVALQAADRIFRAVQNNPAALHEIIDLIKSTLKARNIEVHSSY